MKKIIAHQGETRFLLDLGENEQGQILDLGTGMLYPPIHILSIFGRGYWEEYNDHMDFFEFISQLSCPKCGSNMIEDAWEIIEETPNGNIIMDPFTALVCSDHCGYYIKLDYHEGLRGENRMVHRPSLFSFATSELSQDAFICWLVSWVNQSEDQEMKDCARSFVSSLYNLKHGEGSSTSEDVSMICDLKRQYQKIDVYFQAMVKNKRVSFIIEDKVNTSHHSEQLQRYLKVIKDDKVEEDEIIAIYFKTGYLYEWDYQAEKVDEYTQERFHILNYGKLHQFLQSHPVENHIYQDYCSYIDQQFDQFYPRIFDQLYNDGNTSHFTYDFAQYDFMKRLAESCPAHISKNVVYNGNNPDGSPFTHYKFVQFKDGIAEGCPEAIFYRLDQRKNDQSQKQEYYLSIRQHAFVKGKSSKVKDTKVALKKKLERLEVYQRLFDSIDLSGLNIRFSKIQSDRSGRNESEIAILFFDDKVNTPSTVLKEIPVIHQTFVQAIKDTF